MMLGLRRTEQSGDPRVRELREVKMREAGKRGKGKKEEEE